MPAYLETVSDEIPARLNNADAVNPAGPAPTTSTSVISRDMGPSTVDRDVTVHPTSQLSHLPFRLSSD